MALHAKSKAKQRYLWIAAVCFLLLAAVLSVVLFRLLTPSSSHPSSQSGKPSASTTGSTSVIPSSSATETTVITSPTTKTTVSTVTTTTTTTRKTTVTTTTTPTQPPVSQSTEMRGTWVSYIELNELLSGKTVQQAKNEINAIMDHCVSYGLNAVFFHVRANSDAYYDSTLFKAAASVQPLLDAGFDPLAYAVQAAHQRGLQLHAWINPYRIGWNQAYIVRDVPYFKDNSNVYYYVPSEPKTRELIVSGVSEVLRYGVDGIHFDDYFYPTSVSFGNEPLDFERQAYQAYLQEGGTASVEQWRRMQVDLLVQRVYQVAHQNSRVFGISPSAKIDSAYHTQYADLKKWLSKAGYVDYLCPQIYYGIQHATHSFTRILSEWAALPRHSSVKLYVGLAVYKVGLDPDVYAGASGAHEWVEDTALLYKQLRAVRQQELDGIILYSYTYLSSDTPRATASGQRYDQAAAATALRLLLEELKNG